MYVPLQIVRSRVGQNRIYTPYIWSSPQGVSAIYGVYIQFWPTLVRTQRRIRGMSTAGQIDHGSSVA
jgi:hypothetical protein